MDDNRIQIEEIKTRLDIVNEISKYVELKNAGKNYSGRCPFHNEKTPSFIVSPELQRYKCFGCGESGDIFNFIQKVENIDFPETLEKLAKEAGVELKKPEVNSHISKLYEINKLAARYFFKELKKHKEAYDYVKKRGFTDESIFKFGIGYASGGFGLLENLQSGKMKFNRNELLDSGLFTLKENKLRTKFFKRIMFPIRSSSGKIVGFSGRILPTYDKGPKYMNTPETPIYHKKDNVFGQFESRKAIRKEDLVILCEGQTDVISAHQYGIENIVAPLGTGLTLEQIKNLSKLTKNFLFIFDSDNAGQSAMQRAFILVSQLDLQAYAASPEPYKDIDEMLVADPKILESLIKRKVDLFSFLFSKKVETLDSADYTDITSTLNWTKKLLSQVGNQSLRSTYVNVLLNRHFFDSNLIDDLRKDLLNTNMQISSTISSNNKSKENSQISRQEKLLCKLLLDEKISLPKNLDIKYFSDENVRKILEYIKKHSVVTKKDLLKEDFKEYIEDTIFHFSQIDDKDNINTLYNLIKDYYNFKEAELKRKIAIAEAQGNIAQSEQLLQEFLKLTEELKNET